MVCTHIDFEDVKRRLYVLFGLCIEFEKMPKQVKYESSLII